MAYTFEQLPEIVDEIFASNKKIITIAGPSASGKSFFAKKLAAAMREQGASILEISSDDYYHDDTQLNALIYGTLDHPNLIQYQKLNEDLKTYLQTGKIRIPQYSFVEKRTVDYKEVDEEYDFILVEGIYAIAEIDTHLPEFTIFVTSPREELLMRRFVRDQERTRESWDRIIGNMDNMFPMWNVYGKKQSNADVVIHNTYNILDEKGERYEIIDPSLVSTDREVTEKIHAIDHIYLDQDEGLHNDLIILSENYDAQKRETLRSVTVKNVLNVQKDGKNWQKMLKFRFYQPGIITSLHSLFQLAGLDVSHTTHVNKTYFDAGKENYVLIEHLDKDEQELFKIISKEESL